MKSAKKVLRERLGKLHFEYLKRQRGIVKNCEICGKVCNDLGRFHIIPVSRSIRLEFADENILLAGYQCCHNNWHHYPKSHPIHMSIHYRIRHLRGNNYIENLIMIEKSIPKQDELWLREMIDFYKKILK